MSEIEKRKQDRQHAISIRNSLRYFVMQPLDTKKVICATVEDITLELLKNFPCATAAEIGAARQVAKFIKTDSNRAYITDNVDGKLAQSINLPELKKVLTMSEEELQNVVQNYRAPRSDNTSDGSTSSLGTATQEDDQGVPF